ncbi:hypothetical protein POVWA2_006320 [Plasmodium ovale wallikeri]|uniref:Uncharacterized protein n=1 Tax=Plasmodium ovale wallikeri TaxID=864142 RepID=A0A1A8YKC4_PLAOA|nr:hypothetical protein POVWA1_006100 [Plasmodium ovale wallikeri]SBT31822.1 hypothetical protein POVWA2_006320 [Plasmodium ovale wallikeri]
MFLTSLRDNISPDAFPFSGIPLTHSLCSPVGFLLFFPVLILFNDFSLHANCENDGNTKKSWRKEDERKFVISFTLKCGEASHPSFTHFPPLNFNL